jgi:hypothetical protein
MVYRIVAVLALLCGVAQAQQTNTVYAQLVTNSQVANIFVTLPSKYNIGQPFHLVTATLADAPGHTCSNVNPDPNTNGPFLDVYAGPLATTNTSLITNYTRVVTPGSTSPTNRFRMIVSAAGAYPIIQVNFANYDNTDCMASIFYSGGLVAIDVKKYTTFGGISDALHTLPINATTSPTIIVPGSTNITIVVYGLILYNPTAQTVTIQDLRADTVTANPIVTLTTFCAGCSLVLPNTNFPIFRGSMGGSIRLSFGATPVTGMVMFRFE